MDGPLWAHHRLHDRWSTLLLRFGFEKGIAPCFGALRSTGGVSEALLFEAPMGDVRNWRVGLSRGVAEPEAEPEIWKELLERLAAVRFPVRQTKKGRTLHFVPVRDGEVFLGVLALKGLWGRSISVGDHAFLLELAALLGKVWGRERRIGALEEGIRLLSMGSRLCSLAEQGGKNPEGVLTAALDELRHLAPFDCCTLYGLDWETFRVEPFFIHGTTEPFDLYEDETFLLGEGLRSLALEQGKAIVLDDVPHRRVRSYAAIPAAFAGDGFRAVGVFGARDAAFFSPRKLDWLETFMKRLTSSWGTWVQLERWKAQAQEDEITGLKNKRSCLQELGQAWKGYEAQGGLLAVALFDLDHFKQVNDGHGHLAGDVVLGSFGELLREVTGGMGLPCRFGGEEFLLLMPGKEMREVVLICDEIRRRFAQMQWRSQLGPIRATVSCGIAEAHRDGVTNADALVALADTRLYLAKGRGRNRVVFSD